MSSPRDPTAIILLASIRGHLRAAESVLILGEADDPVTACEAALAELRTAVIEHDQYIHGLSHDLRNALTTISGQAQLLERYLAKGTLDPARVRIAVERIDEAVRQMNEIIHRLNDTDDIYDP